MTTTGSTGIPKMVEMPTNSTRAHGKAHFEKWDLTGNDIFFTPAFFWTGPTSCGVYVMPQVGGKIIMEETFDAGEALQIIQNERPTYWGSFPSQVIDLVSHADFDKYDKSSLRFFHTAGAPFPPTQVEECENKLKVPYMNGYGAIDSSMLFLSKMGTPKEIRLTTAGKPSKWDDYKVVKADGSTAEAGEIGTLYWRGPGGSSGYYKDIELTKKIWGELGKNGWYNTEDAAYLDKEGYVHLVGRVRDLVLRGGQKIFPSEIESVISGHPEIAGVQIVAMPDTRLGEKACGYIIPKGKAEINLDKIGAYLGEKGVAKVKYPERVEIIKEFPMVGQKINRRALSLDICNKLAAEGEISAKLTEDFKKMHNLV